MTVKLLTEHHLEFLRLKGGCSVYSKYTLVKIPHCWKSHVTAQYYVVRTVISWADSFNVKKFDTILISDHCLFNRKLNWVK